LLSDAHPRCRNEAHSYAIIFVLTFAESYQRFTNADQAADRRRADVNAPAIRRGEMTDIERLLAIEEIKRFKSSYFCYLDHKDWARSGHIPDVEILPADSARGIWAMEDILRLPKDQPSRCGYTYLHGFGHYNETYVRSAIGWRIKSTRLTRLHVERS
jgi:SnoaL-like domain